MRSRLPRTPDGAGDVKRTHVSEKPIDALVAKPALLPDHPMKPNGFWYEVDGDWQWWCAGEELGWLEGRKLYELTLDPAARLLEIRTVAEIDAFHAEYSRPLDGSRYSMYPEWGRVAERYDGIEIAPYLWERRLATEFMWYYGWDCASGCLWNPRGSTVRLVCDSIALPKEVPEETNA